MQISRLLYFSKNEINLNQGSVLSQIDHILSSSNRNNQLVNITGALLFDELWFIQILEGERGIVFKTFERLKADERHSNVTLVEFTDTDARLFGNWWMGFARRDETTQAAFEPYLRQGKLYPEDMSGQQLSALIQDVAKVALSHHV